MPPPAPPIILPELFETIFSYLTQNDLAQCARVSRDWSTASTPLLWKSISIMSSKDYYRFQAPEAQGSIIRNESYIREFRTVFVPVIECIVCCTHLTTLDLNRIWSTPSLPPPPEVPLLIKDQAPVPTWTRLSRFTELELSHMTPAQEQIVLEIIHRNPHLQVLKIGDHFQNREELLDILTDDRLPHLQDLSLFKVESSFNREKTMELSRDIDIKFETALRFLDNCPQGIKSLLIDLQVLEEQPLDATKEGLRENLASEPSSPPPCLPHPDLVSLNITSSSMSETNCQRLLQRFLTSCGNGLKYISTPFSMHRAVEPLMTAIHESEYARSKVLATATIKFFNADMAGALSQEPEYTSIDLSSSAVVRDKPAALQSLYDRCERLEHINLMECNHFISSQVLQEILCRSPHLVELQAQVIDVGYLDDCDPCLSARDIGLDGRMWSCARSLKTLAVKIVDVPRPDIAVGHDGRAVEGELFSGTVEESRAVQRRIYSQLAELTRLEKLYLGRMDDADFIVNPTSTDAQGRKRTVDPMFQLTCLEMSLESGLDMLAGLTEMRVVDLRRMGHNVGILELEWMQTHWKKLERVSGLFDRWYPALAGGVRDWIEENNPVWGWEYRKQTFYESDLCADQYFWGYTDIWEDYWE
ncbi:hypothetical protein BG000_009457 [Podila horticola]|nr:hypothetical protein BG000_009457 [Podila horticola]